MVGGRRKGSESSLKPRLQAWGEGPWGEAVSGDRRAPEWALPSQQLPESWQMEAASRRMEMFSLEPCCLQEAGVRNS